MNTPFTTTRASVRGTLPDGVGLFDLARHSHDRGTLTEIYRQDWWPYGPARQWNLVTSPAKVLRGIHVHTHSEYYALVAGAVLVGFRDIRPGSPTFERTAVVELRGPEPQALVAPPWIAHGLYALESMTLLVGTTETRDPARELGCHWQDPALQIPWPFDTAVVSAQDDARGGLQDLMAHVPPYEPRRRFD